MWAISKIVSFNVMFSPLQLFHSFGNCDYLIFHRGNAPHLNCHLFGPKHLSYQDYLGTCQSQAHPLYDQEGSCFANSEGFCPGCTSSSCRSCNKDDFCAAVGETGCSMTSPVLLASESSLTKDECQSFCTEGGGRHHLTYFVLSKAGGRCECSQAELDSAPLWRFAKG